MNKQLILLEKKVAFSKLPSIIKQDDLCYFFSKDYLSYIKLNKIIPDDCEVLNLSGRLSKEIKRLKKLYLTFFASLNEKYDSQEWWGSQISSRSSTAIPLQLNTTYLFCAKNIIDETASIQNINRVIFIADSQALLDSVSIIGSHKNYKVHQPKKKIIKTLFLIRLVFVYLLRIAFFLYQSYKNRRLAFSSLKPLINDKSNRRKKIVLRSWITKGTLNNNGIYVDRNFGKLPDWLKSKGYKVMILPMFFNLGKTNKKVYSLMAKQNIDFLMQDHYLVLIDYFKIIYLGFKEITIPFENITLETLDLTLIFREIQLQQGFSPGGLLFNQCYTFLNRLNRLGFKVDRFYYPFENNVPEKLFNLGCKKYFPNSDLIAYQHSAWYENQLSMFFAKNEASYHPIADKIICSGPIYLDVLKNAGFPENRLIAGPNLRFTSVRKDISTLNQNIKRPNILLPLTFDNDLAYDIIHKVKIISKDFPGLFVYIRRHPLLNYKKLEEFLDEIELTNFQYADNGSIQDWLSYTEIVLSTGGSIVIVETVAMGVPLIRVEPDNTFFLDPFAWSDYPIQPVKTPDEIRNAINSILGMEKEDKDKIQAIGKDVLFNYFTEINDNTMKVFN